MFRMIRELLSTSPMMGGDDVLMVQRRLAAFGVALELDGLYGDRTAGAVRKFQSAHDLVVDGIVGRHTWKALFGVAEADLPPSSRDLANSGLSHLSAMHGYYKDGCRWRLGADGIEVEGEGLLKFSTDERTLAADVLKRFRQELLATFRLHPVPIELVVACISAESSGNPGASRMEPGCDRNNPENTPSCISVGLMQTLLSTARLALGQPELRLAELPRPETSIRAGTAYIEQQSAETRYDPPLVAAAYNAGSLRYNGGADNRWKLLQYRIGTSEHVDRFLRGFNAAMAVVDAAGLPDDVPSMRRSLKDTGTPHVAATTPQPAQPSPATAGATGRSDIASAIRNAAAELGVDAEILGAVAFIESSFRVDIPSGSSDAFGLFQFTGPTWVDVVGRHGAQLGVSAGDRKGLRAQCLMGAAFLRDNMQALQNALGRQPQPGECYAAHFFGLGGATRLLKVRPDMRADAALGNSAETIIGANKPIFIDDGRIRTVGEVMDLFVAKMRDGLDQARDLFASLPARTPTASSASSAATSSEMAPPPWLTIARNEIGQKEAAGDADNPRVVEYFATTTLGPSPDSVPWCGAFVSFCLHQAGVIDKGSARAADWLKIGEPLAKPRLGCIAVLRLGADESSDHVGFWIKEEEGQTFLLGGNQHNCVNITPFPVGRLQDGGLRWPLRAA
ncbi:MAG: TIGR02594 family protein [Acetobacteraceae bacterium]